MTERVLTSGFNPSPHFRVTLNSHLYDLMEEAPYDANALVFFKKEGQVYSGLLIIASSEHDFVANATDVDVTRLEQRLLKDVRRKIRLWSRAHRRGYDGSEDLALAQ